MKYLSQQLLNDLYSKTEKNINKAVREWQQLPNIRFVTQPAPGQWSMAQCLEHLNSYGRYYLPAIEKTVAASAPRHNPSFKSGLLGNYFYKIMLPDTNGLPKKKMKAPKDHIPALQLEAVKVLEEFISQLEWLGQLLTKARTIDLNKAKVAISIAPFIKLKLGDVFLFLTAHINRHLSQAERALEASCQTAPHRQTM